MRPPATFETERLQLRPPTLDDAEAMFTAYASDPVVTRYMTWRPYTSVDGMRAFLEQAAARWEDGGHVAWVITHRDDDRVLGSFGMRLTPPRAELGYVIARPEWNRGYATEVVTAVVAWALGQAEVHRVGAVCSVENPASARVLEKAGMRFEGVLRRWLILPNLSEDPVDVQSWARVKDD